MIRKMIFRKIGLPLLSSLFCMIMCVTSYAKNGRAVLPDLTRTGSISVTMRSGDPEEPIPGGSMTLYKAAAYIWDGNTYIFRYEDEFTGFIQDEYYFDFGRLNAEMAEELAKFADEKSIEGLTKDINDDGTVEFPNLETGLYLLVQKEPPEDYYCVNPFFVTVPMLDESLAAYIYNVNASPKTRPYEEKPKQEWTPLDPAYTHPATLDPAYTYPAELDPAYTKPTPLEPAYIDQTEIVPAQTATPSDAAPEEPVKPTKTTSHHSSGEGEGSRTISNTSEPVISEAEDERWELTPLAKTGERQNILFGGMIFVLSGILLLIVGRIRLKYR